MSGQGVYSLYSRAWNGFGELYGPDLKQAQAAAKAKPRQRDGVASTGPQTFPAGYTMAGGTLPSVLATLFGAGGQTGAGRWTYFPLRPGEFETYRLMNRQPMLQFLLYSKINRILASTWTVKSRFSDRPANDRHISFIRDCLLPQRRLVLTEALQFLWSGFRPFEKVWDATRGDGMLWLTLKPLLPDWTYLYRDTTGKYIGLRAFPAKTSPDAAAKVTQDDENFLGTNRSWICTNEGEAGNFYGDSRHDNAYETFCDWQQNRLRKLQTAVKIGGSIVIIYHPPGQSEINGEYVWNDQIAQEIGQALTGGENFVTSPSVTDNIDQVIENSKLAGTSLWKVEVVDTSNYSEGIKGFLESDGYLDKCFCRAWRTPERAAIEAQLAGSRADSETGSDMAVDDLEAIEDSVVDQFNQGNGQGVTGCVDDALRYNFGESAVGSVVVDPAPLVDVKRQYAKEVMVAIATKSPQVADEIWARLDKGKFLEDADLPLDPNFDLQAFLRLQAAKATLAMPSPGGSGGDPATTTTPAPGTNRIKGLLGSNGNGNGNGSAR